MVYKVRDPIVGRYVAVKILSEELFQDRQLYRRFQRETSAAGKLRYPNICTIYDFGEHHGRPYVSMEFLAGRSLRDRVAAKRCEVEDLLDAAIQIAEGLDAAHARGIAHGDIKPENIFITDRREIKILNFGVPKRPVVPDANTGATITRRRDILESVAYMSPEQARGEKLDARSDLFSLGVTLYEMATGAPPFTGPAVAPILDAILHRQPPPVTPPELDRIVTKLLGKERKARYQSARDLLIDLKRWGEQRESERRVVAPRIR